MLLQKIPNSMITDIINEYQLELYNGIWHYSFHDLLLTQEFILKKTINGKIALYSQPYNKWSPAPFFTNFNTNHNIVSNNIVNKKYFRSNSLNNKLFWFLKIDTFTEFLEERTNSSTQPSKHFPTSKNYLNKRIKINGDMDFFKYDESFFYKHYNNLKQKHHYDAETIYNSLINTNPGLPEEWIRIATLSHNNKIVAILMLIDDGKSLSLFNIASERNKYSLGLVLCTDIVKYCCENGYYSFDAGVSGLYGTYKDKIFLHSRELNQPKQFIYINKFSKIVKRYSTRFFKKKLY